MQALILYQPATFGVNLPNVVSKQLSLSNCSVWNNTLVVTPDVIDWLDEIEAVNVGALVLVAIKGAYVAKLCNAIVGAVQYGA